MMKIQVYEMTGEAAAMKGLVLLTGGGTEVKGTKLPLPEEEGGGTAAKGTTLPLPEEGGGGTAPKGNKLPLPEEEGGEQPLSHVGALL